MDILGYLMLTVFGAVVFFTLIVKMLAPKAPVEEETAGEMPRRTEPTPTDVDRFLAEVNRRRREAEWQPSSPPVSAPPRREASREPLKERDQQRERERERESTRRDDRSAPARRVSEEQARRLPMVQAVEVVEVVDEAAPAPKFQGSRVAARPPSPVMTEVARLLRSPARIGAAMVLQEVIGPPLCRRRRIPGSAVPPRGQG